MNQLYYGDNLDVIRKYIKDETVDLCYIDPPFNSKRNYNQIYNNIGKEDKAQAQAFVDTWEWNESAEHGFTEIITNRGGVFTKQSIELIQGLLKVLGKSSLMAYVISITLRVAEIYRVLKQTGSFYFHCDPTASHYIKLICDSIFCARSGEFQNEIVWWYLWGGRGRTKWNPKHDIIFFYTKSSTWLFQFNEVLEDHTLVSDSSKSRVKYKGALVHHRESKDSEIPSDKVLPSDTWYIPTINAMAKERLGYPTQKPEALLEKIIKASSKKDDVVLDIYCGCGTTIAIAEKLGRKWIGIDITYQSISLILKRLSDSYGKSVLDNVTLHGIPKDIESAIALANKKDDRVRKEFEKFCVLSYTDNTAIINEKKGGDGGIDGISYLLDSDESGNNIYKQVIFSVKSDKIVHPSYVRDLYGTINREGAVMGVLIVLYPKESIVKESKKYGLYTNKLFKKDYPVINIISVEDILNGERIPIPTSNRTDVVKSAEVKEVSKNQITMEL